MKITKIVIESYKSIKEPVEINFFDSLPTVLIGKNGSGKTGIAEALNDIFEANGNYFGFNRKPLPKYRVHIQLSKNDVIRLFPGENIDESKCKLIAYPGENCKIDRIESEYLVPLLNYEINDINKLADELKKELEKYQKQFEKISYEGLDEKPARCFQLFNHFNSTTNYETLKYWVEITIKDVKSFDESLLQNFETEKNCFRIGDINTFRKIDICNLIFRLQYEEPNLAAFEKNFITVNKTAVKREITKINKATKESCDRITELIREIDERIKRLEAALKGERLSSDTEGTFYKFIREVQKCVGSKCLFLRNESNNVMFQNNDMMQEYYRGDQSFVILDTYLNKVYKGADKEELLKQIKENKDFSLSTEALEDFEKYLNSEIPEFEKGMYESISVESSGGKIPKILLRENSGETISLDSTSAGRRWYFTYYFMKSTLQAGDNFIIDEPAAMLHPSAQKEVLKELLSLQENGIKVIYSTHSPYLIPDKWECVHFVVMEDKGTAVNIIKTQGDYFDKMKQISGSDIFNLQGILEKYRKSDRNLVSKKCCEALIYKYQSLEVAAENINYSMETLKSWKKGKRGMTFENLILTALAVEKDPEELL